MFCINLIEILKQTCNKQLENIKESPDLRVKLVVLKARPLFLRHCTEGCIAILNLLQWRALYTDIATNGILYNMDNFITKWYFITKQNIAEI